MMTLEEAIDHCEEVAKIECGKCAEEHLQLAEWLKELKRRGWIPVTERLPDNSRNVLITSRGGVSMAWYNGSYFEKGANTHHRKMQTVTAWCELPEPFKGVTT